MLSLKLVQQSQQYLFLNQIPSEFQRSFSSVTYSHNSVDGDDCGDCDAGQRRTT
jgi:hypothetical protein